MVMENQRVSQGVKIQLQAVASLRQTQAVLLTGAERCSSRDWPAAPVPSWFTGPGSQPTARQTSCAQGKDSS